MKRALGVLLLGLAAVAAEPQPAQTPAEAARTFYEALNKGTWASVDKLRSTQSLAAERALPPEIQKLRLNAADAVTKFHTLTKVEVLKENIQGARAWVDVRLHYKDGTSEKFNCGLVIEGGTWKTTDD